MRILTGFLRFWWDFVIGDDWRIALGVVAVLGAGALAVSGGGIGDALLAPLVALAIAVVVTVSVVTGARR